jgi:RimJ/RimL family protein N-acetyltransferase
VKEYLTKNGGSVVIRQAEEKDIQGVIDVMDGVASERKYAPAERISGHQRELVTKSIREKIGLLAVAEINGRIVGECSLEPKSYLGMSQHAVDLGINIIGDFRGIGIGKAMMDYMIGWAKEKGYEKIMLSVFSTNQRAINLYKKFGFKIEGMKKKEYMMNGEYADEVLMELFL